MQLVAFVVSSFVGTLFNYAHIMASSRSVTLASLRLLA